TFGLCQLPPIEPRPTGKPGIVSLPEEGETFLEERPGGSKVAFYPRERRQEIERVSNANAVANLARLTKTLHQRFFRPSAIVHASLEVTQHGERPRRVTLAPRPTKDFKRLDVENSSLLVVTLSARQVRKEGQRAPDHRLMLNVLRCARLAQEGKR